MITVVKKPPVMCLADNPGIVELSTNISGYINPRLLVDVGFIGIAGSGGSDILFPLGTEVVSCDIREYLRSVFYAQQSPAAIFTLPEFGKNWEEVTGHTKKYQIYIRERSNDGPNDVDFNIADRWAMPGKIPAWKNQSFYQGVYSSFWSWILGRKPFLTFAPKTIPTTATQIQKLYWLCYYVPTAGHAIKLRIKLYFTDGTTGEYEKENFSGTLTQYSVYQFHVGYTALDIQYKVNTDFDGKEVVAYDITAVDGDLTVSETRTYVLNTFEHEAERQLAFRNSLGVFDTIMLTGETFLEREHTPEVVRVLNPAKSLPMKRTLRSEVSETIKASTGWLSTERRLYLAELLGSTEVYEIVGVKLYPVVMTKQTMVAARDNEELQAVNIEYQYVESYFVEGE